MRSFGSCSVILIILMSLVGSVFAQDLDYVYPTSNNVTVNRPCFNSESPNGWCTVTTACELSVLDSKNNIILSNQAMTNNEAIQTYTINQNLTSNSIYQASISCVDGNVTGADTFYFGINSAGSDYRENKAIWFILGIVILIMLIFSIFVFLVEEWLKLAFFIGAFLMLPVSLWLATQIVENSFMNNNLGSVASGAFSVSVVSFFAIVMYACWKLIMGLKIKKEPEYGAPVYRNKGDRR